MFFLQAVLGLFVVVSLVLYSEGRPGVSVLKEKSLLALAFWLGLCIFAAAESVSAVQLFSPLACFLRKLSPLSSEFQWLPPDVVAVFGLV